MSLGYYFLLPVLFSFLTPLFKKFGSLRASSVLLNAILFLQAFSYTKIALPKITQFSIAPPLGIAFILDNFSLLFLLIFTFSGLIVSMYMLWYFKENDAKHEARFYVLFHMLISGSIGMILSSDIFNIYIFFEIVGISSYSLAAYNKDKKALEGGIKYLIIGSIASIFIVFAIMLIYLQIGTVNLGQIAQRYNDINPTVGVFIALMLLIGFGTKAELFPLNFWVPDVYQGSSSQVAGLFSSVVSKSYLFVFFHLFYLFGISEKYMLLIMVLGAVTFLVSELTALNQKDIKRLFAYSTLGQLGLLFMALSSNSSEIISGALFHLTSHSIGKLLIFLALGILISKFNHTKISIFGDFKSKFLSAVFIIAFLSILGIPPFSGFVGKLLMLKGFAIAGNYVAIAFILIVSIIEAVYFFRLIVIINKDNGKKQEIKVGMINYILLSILAGLLILFGFMPSLLTNFTDLATKALLHPELYLNFALGGGL